jgi:hypothetical protein
VGVKIERQAKPKGFLLSGLKSSLFYVIQVDNTKQRFI